MTNLSSYSLFFSCSSHCIILYNCLLNILLIFSHSIYINKFSKTINHYTINLLHCRQLRKDNCSATRIRMERHRAKSYIVPTCCYRPGAQKKYIQIRIISRDFDVVPRKLTFRSGSKHHNSSPFSDTILEGEANG